MNDASPTPGVALEMGASGYIGSHLVSALRAQGYRVRAASRNPVVLEGREWDGVESVAADALDPASLDRALAGVSVAWYLVHSMAAGRDFGDLDRRAAAGEIYDAADPEVLTYAEIMGRLGRILGRSPVIIPVPVLTPRLSSYWLRLVTTVPTNIARALIDGLVHDVTARDRRRRDGDLAGHHSLRR